VDTLACNLKEIYNGLLEKHYISHNSKQNELSEMFKEMECKFGHVLFTS